MLIVYNLVMYHLKKTCESEIEVKKSRFIGLLYPLENPEDASAIVAALRKKHYSASHFCTALRCSGIERSNDDGEPSSTAGLPMLEVLRHHEVDNILAVVIRYFGGTLLGTGGLVRAYQQAVNAALEVATLTVPCQLGEYRITIPYELTNRVENLLAKETVTDRQYDEQLTVTFLTERDLKDEFLALSQGRCEPVFIRNVIIEKEIK